MQKLIDKLRREHTLLPDELLQLVKTQDKDALEYLRSSAEKQRQEFYGRDIYIRGLIEFTSFCKNDCYYCGLRKSNKNAQRYRLSKEQILDCCKQGYELGFRTFVLQGGEDAFYTNDKITDIVRAIRKSYPDCAITLSIGEKSRESYQKYFDAGADRYLLRHETADSSHYARLHPKELSLSDRKKCL